MMQFTEMLHPFLSMHTVKNWSAGFYYTGCSKKKLATTIYRCFTVQYVYYEGLPSFESRRKIRILFRSIVVDMLGSKCTSNERTFGEGDGEKEEEQGERERLLPNL